jgi:uncharacterized SAM-binding protein YcdF (DUF218 family)
LGRKQKPILKKELRCFGEISEIMTEREKCIAIINNDIIKESDAIVLLEGDGFYRYHQAVSLYNQRWAKRIIFSGGITNYEYGSYPFNDVLPHILAAGVPDEAIIHEDKSLNTKEQAEQVLKIADSNKWKRLILVASHEHQYRAYLTFLRQVIDLNNNIIIFNSPAKHLGWFNDSGWGARFKRLEIEFEKIEKYSKLGHLATFEEVIQYQKWKEQQV